MAPPPNPHDVRQEESRAMKFGISQPLTRKEDDALLRGAGRYVADVAPAGALAAVVLRSPHAHAEFRVTDVARARALPGVRLVLLADDIAELGAMPCTGVPPDVMLQAPVYPVLARQGRQRRLRDAAGRRSQDPRRLRACRKDGRAHGRQPAPGDQFHGYARLRRRI